MKNVLVINCGSSSLKYQLIEMGGESVLLPVEIGHQYRTGKQCRVPYGVDEEMERRILWNRYKLVVILPIAPALREKFIKRLASATYRHRFEPMLAMDKGQLAHYHQFLRDEGKATMAEYFERYDMPEDFD